MDCGMEKAEVSDRKHGRRAKALPQNPQAEHKEIIKALLKTFTHFFGSIDKRLGQVPDPRRPQRPQDIGYSMACVMFSGVLMFVCRLGARRQVRLLLHTVFMVQTFKKLFEVDDVPHGDTINNVYCRSDVAALQEIVTGMTETLIDKKVLYPHRLFAKYYVVAVDATGMLTYGYRHCPYCLSKKHNDKTLYYHHVLEAKIVTPTGIVLSLMSEFIENPEDDPAKSLEQRKQDCELKAFYRLAKSLHKRLPKLPVLLVMDGLYAVGPVFGICRRYSWKFMICLSDDQLSSVNEEFEALCVANPTNRLDWRTGKKTEIRQQFRWTNDIAYIDSNKGEHTLSVLECIDTRPGKNDEEQDQKVTKFKWVCSIRVTPNNVVEQANQAGRLRWKIENEAFNVQKNGGYKLEHAYSNDENAIKVYYLLLQIAHTLVQLLDRGSLLRNAFPRGFGSVKNLAFRILEALRNAALSDDEYCDLCDQRIQIRFQPP
jgi:hypothetical protein